MQITNSFPRRLTILQWAQIFFTEALTFIDSLQYFLFIAQDNSSFTQIIGAHLESDSITWQKTDVMNAHTT